MMLTNLLRVYLQWAGAFAPEQTENGRLRTALAFFSSGMGMFFSIALGSLVFVNGEELAGYIFFALAVWMFAMPVLYVRKWISFATFGNLCFSGLVIVNISGTILLGGLHGSAATIIWSLVPAMLAPILISTRHTIYWMLIFIAAVAASIYLPGWLDQTSQLTLDAERFLFFFNMIGMSGFILAVLQFFIIQRDEYQERSESLLLNILPREIADILRSEKRVVADAFEGASILFADVVNFTPMSAAMTPVELVNLLNEVFSHFDMLTEKHHLEKIKTIGDCYMVASGIPIPRADHAQAVTRMALDILDYVKSRDFNGRKLSFRIGINSGPVVAGVIGQKKFAYDLWGDAVNTASRMESSGGSNIIQITHSTYELIKDNFECQPQPPVNVKGKGPMDVWHVIGKK
jgi:guanylate cyclase